MPPTGGLLYGASLYAKLALIGRSTLEGVHSVRFLGPTASSRRHNHVQAPTRANQTIEIFHFNFFFYFAEERREGKRGRVRGEGVLGFNAKTKTGGRAINLG